MGKHKGGTLYRVIDENGCECLQPFTNLAEVWETAKTPDWLLWMLDQINFRDESILRVFACWCARQSWRFVSKSSHYETVEVAERFARGETTRDVLVAAMQKASGEVAGAGVCGLTRRLPSAAAQLASFHTAREDAFEAAFQSASFAARAASFAAWQECNNEARAKEAEWNARVNQAEKLVEVVGNPFVTCDVEIRAEPDTLAHLMLLGFIPQLQSDEEHCWYFYSEVLNYGASFDEMIIDFAKLEEFLM